MSDAHVSTVVIGGGQAGLAVGYHLSRRRLPFVILEDNHRIGDAWRKRWDSLRLFTPARYSGLPGMPFPGSPSVYPTKDETADYLEAYARTLDLPVRTGIKVERLARVGDLFEVICGEYSLLADNVVVATGAYNNPRVPPFARELDESIRQLHSKEYRTSFTNPERERAGRRRWQLRRRDSRRARSPPRDMAFGPGHGAGARPGRESSRSPDHAHHVVSSNAIDREHAVGKKAPRPLSRPSSWNPSGARATEGLCRRGDRKSTANDRGEQRTSRSRGRKGPQCRQCDLVHRIRS